MASETLETNYKAKGLYDCANITVVMDYAIVDDVIVKIMLLIHLTGAQMCNIDQL